MQPSLSSAVVVQQLDANGFFTVTKEKLQVRFMNERLIEEEVDALVFSTTDGYIYF
jgi:hypothetical protein